ncbi:MAG: hypothetical protein A2X97_09435 [Bdellovibrionales bacterium GWA1_52_35]|nr:MAG: hypothetical protein A2X97_09435 [Bdellovibrionales bacterium GWA1_52_35]
MEQAPMARIFRVLGSTIKGILTGKGQDLSRLGFNYQGDTYGQALGSFESLHFIKLDKIELVIGTNESLQKLLMGQTCLCCQKPEFAFHGFPGSFENSRDLALCHSLRQVFTNGVVESSPFL